MFKNIFKGNFEVFKTNSRTSININGNHYEGSCMSITDDNVYIDGKQVFSANIDLSITIEGKEGMEVDVGYSKTLNVKGVVSSVSTSSGDITVAGDVNGNVRTASGDIDVKGKVSGDVSTTSGDVDIRGGVGGRVNTISGDISGL